jgi:hypothetical protein
MITLKQPFYHLPVFQVALAVQQCALPLFSEDIPNVYNPFITMLKTKMLLPADQRSSADELSAEFVKLL